MACRASSTRVRRVSSHRTTSAARSSARTRSVTSSRLPIGVAQTASTELEKLGGQDPRADQPGLLAELRLPDPEPLPGRSERFPACDLERRPEQELARTGSEAAAEHHDLRPEEVDERSDRGTEQPAHVRELPARIRVAG